mmetsp:Transcript_2272/g.15140  ORF Transcript_2272/g.15140 Transcript_2272/m.15140 type:complete len:85 (+) Transcript_2272:148-402(+)
MVSTIQRVGVCDVPSRNGYCYSNHQISLHALQDPPSVNEGTRQFPDDVWFGDLLGAFLDEQLRLPRTTEDRSIDARAEGEARNN